MNQMKEKQLEITVEQEETLEVYKKRAEGDLSEALLMIEEDQRNRGDWLNATKWADKLKGFSVEEYALMLCGRYEVVERFQVGVLVVDKGDKHRNVGEIVSISEDKKTMKICYEGEFVGIKVLVDHYRFAEEEEIFWYALDRRFREYLEGDVVFYENKVYVVGGRLVYGGTVVDLKIGEGNEDPIEEHVGTEELLLVTPVGKRMDGKKM